MYNIDKLFPSFLRSLREQREKKFVTITKKLLSIISYRFFQLLSINLKF